MNKSLILLLSFLLLSSASAYIGNLYPYEAKAGEREYLIVTLDNHDGSSVKNAQVTVFVPFLNIYEKTPSFKLDRRSYEKAYLEAFFPETAHGYYPVFITFQNDAGVKEKKHSWIYII